MKGSLVAVRALQSLPLALVPHAVLLLGCLALVFVTTLRQREPLGFLIVHAMTTCCVGIPTLVVLVNGFLLKRPENPVVQLCAIHFVWNSHVIGHAAMAIPFQLFGGRTASYWDVLYDYAVFIFFVCTPVELSTGVVKYSIRKLDWRHRAVMGVACCHLTFFFGLGTYYVRPHSFTLTLLATFGFYGYASSTYLPANPQGDPPEVSGSREWPALKDFLWDFLWDPIRRYMRLSVVFENDKEWVHVDVVNAALEKKKKKNIDGFSSQQQDGGGGRRQEEEDSSHSSSDSSSHHSSSSDSSFSLARAERKAAEALRELAPLCAGKDVSRAHPFRQIEAKLRSAVESFRTHLPELEVRTKNGGLESGEAAIVGFHPHAIIPYNAAIMTIMPEFQLKRCVVATDAFTHAVAWMRDLGQWLGARECTREAMARALRDDRSVVVVPGGQAEIFTTQSWTKTVAVYRGHKGFVRLALAQRKRLVPVVAFGEWELMDNVYLPRIQAWTRKKLGFPFPFMPYGRFLLPLPRRPPKGISVVVGRPLDVEAFLDNNDKNDDNPDDDPASADRAVDRAHAAYFDRLHDLFERFKHQAGYPDHTIHFQDAPPLVVETVSSSKGEKSTARPPKSERAVSFADTASGASSAERAPEPPGFLARNASSIDGGENGFLSRTKAD